MREASLPVPAVPASGSSPARVALIALLVVVGVSLARPWGAGPAGVPDAAPPLAEARGGLAEVPPVGDAPGSGAAGSAGSATVTPTATPRPAPGPGEMACAQGVWRVVSLERLGAWTVRSSAPAAATLARSPLDPAIGSVTLQSPAILSLGVCSPDAPASAAGGGGPMRILQAWRLDGGRATPFPVAAIGGAHAPDLAILYRAAPVGGSVARTWPVGSYVVELAAASDPADAGVEAAARWFMGLVVRLPG